MNPGRRLRRPKFDKGILDRFKDFCLVDQNLKESTVERHEQVIRDFMEFAGDNEADENLVREYLKDRKERDVVDTYVNRIKALRKFFRDFLKAGHPIESFKMPKANPIPKRIPTKSDLKNFYENLPSRWSKCLFLLLASSGLRRNEAIELTREDVDFEKRMLMPSNRSSTKKAWVTFYSEDAEKALLDYLDGDERERIFEVTCETYVDRVFRQASKKSGIKITPKDLRFWFANEMGRLGIPDRYIDAFCGCVPSSVLAKHYTDFSPERLKEVYDRSGLKVLKSC